MIAGAASRNSLKSFRLGRLMRLWAVLLPFRASAQFDPKLAETVAATEVLVGICAAGQEVFCGLAAGVYGFVCMTQGIINIHGAQQAQQSVKFLEVDELQMQRDHNMTMRNIVLMNALVRGKQYADLMVITQNSIDTSISFIDVLHRAVQDNADAMTNDNKFGDCWYYLMTLFIFSGLCVCGKSVGISIGWGICECLRSFITCCCCPFQSVFKLCGCIMKCSFSAKPIQNLCCCLCSCGGEVLAVPFCLICAVVFFVLAVFLQFFMNDAPFVEAHASLMSISSDVIVGTKYLRNLHVCAEVALSGSPCSNVTMYNQVYQINESFTRVAMQMVELGETTAELENQAPLDLESVILALFVLIVAAGLLIAFYKNK